MTGADSSETRPLLGAGVAGSEPATHGEGHPKRSRSPSLDESHTGGPGLQPSRAVEDDVLPEASTLGRTLNWGSCFILVISRVIGSGIFATPGSIIKEVGSPGLALLLWLVGAVVAACGLAVSLEFGSMLPRSGGDKVYLEFTYRRPRFLASVIIAVYAVLLGFTASNCIVFSQYVLFAFYQGDAPASLRKGLAVALLSAITVIHTVFPKAGVRTQNFFGWLKIGIVGFMILSGLYVVLFRQNYEHVPGGSGSNLAWDRLWEDSTWNWGVISTALFKVFYSYAGLDNVGIVLNEVKDPVRTLKTVTLTALATSCGMYFLVNIAYFLVVPVDEIKGSGELIAALFFEKVFGPRVGRTFLPLAVALSAAGNVMVVSFAMARLKQEIARQGLLPYGAFLSSTKPFGSPLGGFLIHFIPTFLVIVLPPTDQVYSFILELEQYPAQIISLAVAFGLIWLRFKRPDLKRPFKAWLPAVAVKMGLSLALLAAPLVPPADKFAGGLFYATYAIVGTSILLLGIVYWYTWTVLIPRWRGYRLEEETEILVDGTPITTLVHKAR